MAPLHILPSIPNTSLTLSLPKIKLKKKKSTMPTLKTLFPPLLLFQLIQLARNVSGVGINYGTLGNNLLPPKKVAQTLQSTLFDKVKIYDTDPDILDAFSNTGIDLIVAVENERIANLSRYASAADDWFAARIAPFLPATSIVAIAVGNEFLTNAAADESLGEDTLLPAMRNVHATLVSHGLDRKIKVTTPHSMAVLASSFPPSASEFAPNLVQTMTAIVEFLADTGSPFMINAYPYFAYRDNPSRIDLEYALLGNGTGVHDPNGYVYTNMLDAQIDAVRSAIMAIGENRTVEITISESGWPSKGDPGDTAATLANARTYNTRLIERADSQVGTPMRPKEKVEVYVFALFNENKKEGSVSERNFGILNGDGTQVYEVELRCSFCSGGGKLGIEEKVGPRGASVWCVAKPHADEKVVQAVLDFCCGPGGVDCRELVEKGGCYEPNKLHAHASYAMNAYYQMHGRNYWNCDFKGTGLVTFSDPSYGACRYPQQ